MPVIQEGSINLTSLTVPDAYIQIVPPSISNLNGVATDILGIVGTATWGPVGAPTTVSDMASYKKTFGPVQTDKYDAGTQVEASVKQGASNMRVVRVTDGTDVAASIALKDSASTPLTGATLTSIYTGTYGNNLTAKLSAGSKASTYKVTVTMPNGVPEVFNNIAGSGATFWSNLVDAINLGQSGVRGPSNLFVATIGTSTATPAAATYTASGGTDGKTTITGSTLLGSDTIPRKGMYALRNTKASIALLADCDDTDTWSDQVSFGLNEGIYMILVGPCGESIDDAISAKASAGIDSYAAKVLLGDWCYYNDTTNDQVRLISPQGFIAGRLANLSPQHSSLNKQIYGIVATQKSSENEVYSSAELGQLVDAGIDVITNPVPGGSYYGSRIGHNSSSDENISGDNYTRMTNYIAYTLDAGVGKYVGKLQTTDERLEAKAMLESFLQNMKDANMIGDVNGGSAYKVTLDSSNNSDSRVAQGYQVADVKVKYLSIIEKFIINVEGGQSVSITKASTTE